MQIHLNSRIVADAEVLSGQPVVAGTAVTVSSLVGDMAAGGHLDEVALAHGVAEEDVRAALEFAARRASEPVTSLDSAGQITSGATNLLSGSYLLEDQARQLGLDPTHLTPLARRLVELRAQMTASGEPLLSTWEELDAEIADRRGGADLDGD